MYGAERLGLTDRMLGDGIAEAAATHSGNSPILVSVFMQGGSMRCRSWRQPEIRCTRRLRPTLAVAPGSGTPFREDPSLTWHPSATSFAQLNDAGKVAVFPGIGYTHPDMSHFTSRHYWEVGATDSSLLTGWMGRYLDVAGDRTNPFQGLSMDGQINPMLATAKNPTAAIDQPNSFAVYASGVWGDVRRLDARVGLFARRQAAQLPRSRDRAGRWRGLRGGDRPPDAEAVHQRQPERRREPSDPDQNPGAAYGSSVTYPAASTGDLPARLAGLAAMIARGVPLRCVALTTDAQFDTHSSQTSTFDSGVRQVADCLAAFQADLEARGVDHRVLVHVWSEFGRRAQENGSDGTDHGAAGTSLLIGSRVNGGMIGEFPSLSRLDDNGNQRENVDFRGVYCSLLEQWFGHHAASVIPGARHLPRYKLLA